MASPTPVRSSLPVATLAHLAWRLRRGPTLKDLMKRLGHASAAAAYGTCTNMRSDEMDGKLVMGTAGFAGSPDGATMEIAWTWEVTVTSSNAERVPEWPPTAEHVPIEELARRQGVRPLKSADDLVRPGLFESDEELDEFLADLYASRRAGMS